MLEIDILRNSSPKFLGVLEGAFPVFGCPKRHPDAPLAKTMSQNTPFRLEVKYAGNQQVSIMMCGSSYLWETQIVPKTCENERLMTMHIIEGHLFSW